MTLLDKLIGLVSEKQAFKNKVVKDAHAKIDKEIKQGNEYIKFLIKKLERTRQVH